MQSGGRLEQRAELGHQRLREPRQPQPYVPLRVAGLQELADEGQEDRLGALRRLAARDARELEHPLLREPRIEHRPDGLEALQVLVRVEELVVRGVGQTEREQVAANELLAQP